MLSSRSVSASLVLVLASACSSAARAPSDCPPTCPDAAPTGAQAALQRPVATVAAVEDLQSAFKQAIARAEPAVVSVYSTKTVALRGPRTPFGDDPLFNFFFRRPDSQPRDFQQRGLGSGVIIDDEGYILTNNHVIEGADEVKVKLHDDRELEATVIGIDPPTDLAVLKVESDDLTAAGLGDSQALEVGDWVLAIGNPFGLPRTVSSGIVSAKGRADVGIVDYEDFIQTDAAVNPGNSGGPLVDLRGRVVGINTAIASRSGGNNGIAFAIPINMAKRIVEQLRTDGKVIRGYLGILISDLSPDMAESFGFEGAHGILVQDVTRDSAGANAGIQNGDIITELDGEPVSSVASFRATVARNPPNASVRLEIWRDGKTQSLTAKLDEAPGRGGAPTPTARPPKIGISLADLTPQLRRELSLERESGVVVTSVAPGSPAALEGVRTGDVLEQVGRAKVTSASQAIKLLRDADLQRGVRLRFVRGGRGRFVFVRIK